MNYPYYSSSSDSDSDSSYRYRGRITRIKDKMRLAVDREALSETMWKWRCKLKGTQNEKTLSDFESDDTAVVADGDAKTAPSKIPELGSTLSVKTMYEGPNSRDQTFDWVDYPPKQLSKSAAKAQDRVAIKVFKVKDTEKPVISGRYSLRYHMLEVQNPLLVAALGNILEKQDLHLDVNETATFNYPFRPLYFGYDDIVAKYKSLKDDEPVKQFMLLLIKLLDDIFAETRAKIASLRSSGLTSFKLAWTLFPRDSTVISWGNNSELLCKVSDTAYQCVQARQTLIITGRVLRFTGRAFQWEDCQLEIKGFAGNKKVTDLPVYPIDLHEKDPEAIKAKCAARGRKVLDYQGLTYVNYSGIALHRDADKNTCKLNVDGRVLIDVVGYNKHHLAKGVREGTDPQTKKHQLVVGSGDASDPDDTDDETEYYRPPTSSPPPPPPSSRRPTSRPHPSGHPHSAGKSAAKKSGKRLTARAQERNKVAMLSPKHEDSLMYMVPLIEGYALKNKLWVTFYVEDISPLVWNDAAYDHLVYDEQQKDLVMSFVENHQGKHVSTVSTSPGDGAGGSRPKPAGTKSSRPKLMDVIAGKGEGLIMLLSGPPGTGKTLMAEAVADRTHRPLFYLQAEDLGTNAAMLGANVKKVFEMATEWDAVILLDEADVFMAERHPQDILRNELVSIFLRELEYFRGIIFLTTNLYSTIDSAFRSRVSLHLLFNPLSFDARLIVWKKFLERLSEAPTEDEEEKKKRVSGVTITEEEQEEEEEESRADTSKAEEVDDEIVKSSSEALTEEDLKDLAAWNLNGREIKTAVKMVRSWCDYKGYEMTLSRLESGIKVTSPHASKSSGEKDTSLYDE